MKVFELMSKLAEQPAGAEVGIYGCITQNELESGITNTETDNDGVVYNTIQFSARDVDYLDENNVVIDI